MKIKILRCGKHGYVKDGSGTTTIGPFAEWVEVPEYEEVKHMSIEEYCELVSKLNPQSERTAEETFEDAVFGIRNKCHKAQRQSGGEPKVETMRKDLVRLRADSIDGQLEVLGMKGKKLEELHMKHFPQAWEVKSIEKQEEYEVEETIEV